MIKRWLLTKPDFLRAIATITTTRINAKITHPTIKPIYKGENPAKAVSSVAKKEKSQG